MDNAQGANAAHQPQRSSVADTNALFFAPGNHAQSSFPVSLARNPSEASEATANNPVNPLPASPPWPPLESPVGPACYFHIIRRSADIICQDRSSASIPDDWELTHSKRVDDMMKKLYERSNRSLPQFPPHLEAFTCISPLSSLSPSSNHSNFTPTPLIPSTVPSNPQTASSQSLSLPSVFLSPTWSTITTRDNSQGLRETRSAPNLPVISSMRVSTPSSKTNFNTTARAGEPAKLVSEKGQDTMSDVRSRRGDDSKTLRRLADVIESAQRYVKRHEQKKPLHFLSVRTVPQIAVQKPAPSDSSRQPRDFQTNQRFHFCTPSIPIPTFHSSTFNPQKLPSSGPFRVSKSSSDVARLNSSPYVASTRSRPWSPPNSPPSNQNLKLDMTSPTRLRTGKSTSSFIRSGPIVHEPPGTGRSEYQSPLKLRTPIIPRQTPDWAPEPFLRLRHTPSNLPLSHASFANSHRTPPIILEPPYLTGTNQAFPSTFMPQHTIEPTSIPITTSSSTTVIIKVLSDNLTAADAPRANDALQSPVILRKASPVEPKTSRTSLSTAAVQKSRNPIRKKVSTAFNKAKSHYSKLLKKP